MISCVSPTYEAYGPADVGVEVTAGSVDVGLRLRGRGPPGQIAVQDGLPDEDLRREVDHDSPRHHGTVLTGAEPTVGGLYLQWGLY